jgi:2-oxoglutarate dehydrogenase E2 component (dihydrolipoamide succinyltransferase)
LVAAPGDFVDTDEVVVVLETDKVSVDVRALFSGVLKTQLAQIDENVLVARRSQRGQAGCW